MKGDVLLVKARKRIYQLIEQFPGVHLRELHRKLGGGKGNLEHHVGYLVKKGLIQVEKERGNKRFFPLGLNDYERQLLGVLRNPAWRKVVIVLLKKKRLNHKRLVEELGLAKSVITRHMQELENRKVVTTCKKGRMKEYALRDSEQMLKVLITYRESFLDQLVDGFIEAWEG